MVLGDCLQPGSEALGLGTRPVAGMLEEETQDRRRSLQRDEIGEAGDRSRWPPLQDQGRGQLAQGKAPFGDRRWAQWPDRTDIQPGLAGQMIEPERDVSLKRYRERGQRQHIGLACPRRWREPHLRPAGDRGDRTVPTTDGTLPDVERVAVEAVLAQGMAEALDHRLVDVLRCDTLGRAPPHQPRQHRASDSAFVVKNGSKMRARVASSMPMPLSRTQRCAHSVCTGS